MAGLCWLQWMPLTVVSVDVFHERVVGADPHLGGEGGIPPPPWPLLVLVGARHSGSLDLPLVGCPWRGHMFCVWVHGQVLWCCRGVAR